MTPEETELLQLNLQLLESIATGDWAKYTQLCDPSISAFEPEARGELVEGLAFHKYYFDLPSSDSPKNTCMVRPHIRLVGDVAVISYVRLVPSLDANGAPRTSRCEETRVWQRKDGAWMHVHFHRSLNE